MGGVALLVLLGVFIEQHLDTDTKRIRRTLDAAAAGLVANDAKQVYACIVPDSDGDAARTATNSALSQARFLEITIRSLEVKFNYQTSPPTSETTFTVWVRGMDRSGMYASETPQPVPMEVKLRKESGRWLVFGKPKYDVPGR